MNELERKLRALLEGKRGTSRADSAAFSPSQRGMALNDNRALARALGADTLDDQSY